jgi:Domain of unknown function (DUF4272)
MEDDLEPNEREILEAPFQSLDRSQQIDARWSIEGARVLSWSLRLLERPTVTEPIDPNLLFELFGLLRADPKPMIKNAMLRNYDELAAYAVEIACIRTALQLPKVDDLSKPIVRNVRNARLSELGLNATDDDEQSANNFVRTMSEDTRRQAAGLSFVHEMAAFWVFRPGRYFE